MLTLGFPDGHEMVLPRYVMASSPGLLLATARGGQGVFLTSDDIDAARAMITNILQRPTVAGTTLDLAKLRELCDQLGDVGKPSGRDTPPTIVSAKGQRLLRIMAAQAAIRKELSVKIVYRCADCGDRQISDPEYEANKHQQEESQFIIAMIGAVLGSMPGGNVGQEERICARCKGKNFDSPTLATFCRECHKLRDENVLVKCPDCGFNFLSLEHGNIWEGIGDATQEFKLSVNLTLLGEAIPKFESQLYDGQVRALSEAISAEETLLGMCRCAWHTEFGRHVALLFTSNKLVWSWETPMSDTESGMVKWQDIQRVRDYDDTGVPRFCGFQLDLRNGKTIIFAGFPGIGIRLSERSMSFDLQGVRDLVRELVSKGSTGAGTVT